MNRNMQTTFWEFIAAYRQHEGEALNYVELLRDHNTLRRHLQIAQSSPAIQLRNLAAKLLAASEDEPHFAHDKVGQPAQPPRPIAAAAASTPDSRFDVEYARNEYHTQLSVVLEDGPITLHARKDLDRFCKQHRLSAGDAEAVEQQVRERMGLAPIDWDEEIRESIRMLREQSRLSERNRLLLYETYIKRGRLSMMRAEEIISEEVLPDIAAQPSGGARAATLAAGLGSLAVAVLAAVVVLARPGYEPPAEVRPATLSVQGPILENTTWYRETTYYLEDVVFVEGSAKLTIEPGTRVLGKPGSALVVTRDATLYARGTAATPIVFSSANEQGDREPGDWGGIVLLGSAPLNQRDAFIEGIPREDIRGHFGGNESSSNCGLLEYVRIEFAGYEAFVDNELNGLTLGGCGYNTIVRHVQVHQALDDGIEVFGGTVDLRNILISGAGDDSLDWDMGWSGRVQFLIAQQHPNRGDNAVEGDNWKADHEASPRSAPTIYNATLIGSSKGIADQRGVLLRHGTGGVLRNFVIAGFPRESILVNNAATARGLEDGSLLLGPMIMHTDSKPSDDYFRVGRAGHPYRERGGSLLPGVNPQLPANAFDTMRPVFTPPMDSPASHDAAPLPAEDFWDKTATYLGAVRPGSAVTWIEGWTSYPAN